MTTYLLTTNQDQINAGNGADFFQGPAGGNDALRGYGGSDFFDIMEGQTGLIDGGTGYDRLYLMGIGNNELDLNLKIARVEELVVDTSNLYATVAQLSGFSTISINNEFDDFSFFLRGAGGTLDFSTSYNEVPDLNIEAEMVDSAVRITGSSGNNMMIGSDFNDTLSGDGGADQMYGGFGADTVNGGLGRDYLYGDDGRDSFLFNTALAGNVDHLGDFRPADDTIKLDDAIFDWAGQSNGTIASSAFKVIGTGQSVDGNDHIIYNQNTGGIYYDVDGAGGTGMKQFAIADNFAGDVPVLTYRDFVIV